MMKFKTKARSTMNLKTGSLRVSSTLFIKLLHKLSRLIFLSFLFFLVKAVNVVASEFDVKILQPLLSGKFIEYAKTVSLSEKIHDSDDLYRKHIIRKLAKDVGVPEISHTKRKKALQYGTKIHRKLLKTR